MDESTSPSDEIDDIEDNDDTTPPITYDISSYGSDPEVEALVNRLNRGDNSRLSKELRLEHFGCIKIHRVPSAGVTNSRSILCARQRQPATCNRRTATVKKLAILL